MTIFPFAEWTPDAAPLGNPGSLTVTNAFPGPTGYKPVPALTIQTNSLDNRPLAAISARDKDGNIRQYAGDMAKLYELTGTTWGDVSKAGGYATGNEEKWEFIRWKNKILATNFSNDPQQIEMGAAAFSDLTTDFKAREISAIGNFVVVGNTTDAADGSVPGRVRWSAFNDETDWTVSPVTLSDFRDLQTGGAVLGIASGEFGVVIQEKSTWRMSFVGAPTVFQLDEVLPGVGALARGSIVQLAGVVYFLSEQGFVALSNGTQATYIGANRIDQFVRNDIDQDFLFRVSAAVDTQAGRIFWAYPGAGNSGGLPNRILCYDRNLDRWSLIPEDVELIWNGSSSSISLDDPDEFPDDIDAVGAPTLDSSIYKGGAPQFAAFDPAFGSGFFAGPAKTAVIDTKEFEFNSGRMTRLTAFRPVVNGGRSTAQMATRNTQSDPVEFGTVASQGVSGDLVESRSGRFTLRANGRYHRARLTILDEWQDAIGIQVESKEARPGENRG